MERGLQPISPSWSTCPDDAHAAPIRFMRDDAAKTGATPTLRRMQTVGGFDIAELYRLFPGKPAKKMAWLAGLRKPVGCV